MEGDIMSRVFITGSSDGLGRMAAQLLIEQGQGEESARGCAVFGCRPVGHHRFSGEAGKPGAGGVASQHTVKDAGADRLVESGETSTDVLQ